MDAFLGRERRGDGEVLMGEGRRVEGKSVKRGGGKKVGQSRQEEGEVNCEEAGKE